MPVNRQGDDNSLGLTLISSLFFMWGFITALNDILIPHLKTLFALSYAQAMLVQFCFFTAYLIVSLPSGYLVRKIGYKNGMIAGLTLSGSGCLLFYPAAGLELYPLFLGGLFVLASGITLLQVAANALVILCGKAETASRRLTLTQGFNSLGTTLAPYLGSLFILSAIVKSSDELNQLTSSELSVYRLQQAASVQMPYLALSIILFLMACIFVFINLPTDELVSRIDQDSQSLKQKGLTSSAWNFRHLKLGALAIFAYVGAEVSIGSFLVSFLGQPEIVGMVGQEAGKYVSIYWGGAMIGRFIGSAMMKKILPQTLLSANAIIAALLVLITIVLTGKLAMWSILSVGLFNSIMFPTIFALALNGLGKHSAQGSGILCMAIVGGAIMPLLQGCFADWIGVQFAFFLPVLCYVYIFYYGFRGYQFYFAEK
jgi:MFS transporter, FHS family, L-fucose permease